MSVEVVVFHVYLLHISTDISYYYPLVCKQRNQVTINKYLGSTFHFQCRKDSHKGEKYKYIHYNQITDKPDLVNVASKHTQRLSSLEDGGDYCCSDQHARGGMISSTTPECCITVASKTNKKFVSLFVHSY